MVNKSPITIAAKSVVTPNLPEVVTTILPNPAITYLLQSVTPAAPSFKVVVGADCNNANGEVCNGHVELLEH